MASWGIVLLASVGAVALFVAGLSLTLICKGHPIDSEIATNTNMQRLGIRCAVQEAREANGRAACSDTAASIDAAGGPSDGALPAGCAGNCAACDIIH